MPCYTRCRNLIAFSMASVPAPSKRLHAINWDAFFRDCGLDRRHRCCDLAVLGIAPTGPPWWHDRHPHGLVYLAGDRDDRRHPAIGFLTAASVMAAAAQRAVGFMADYVSFGTASDDEFSRFACRTYTRTATDKAILAARQKNASSQTTKACQKTLNYSENLALFSSHLQLVFLLCTSRCRLAEKHPR